MAPRKICHDAWQIFLDHICHSSWQILRPLPVCQVEGAHPPQVTRREAFHAWERRPEILRQALDDARAPALAVLPGHDVAAYLPVEP